MRANQQWILITAVIIGTWASGEAQTTPPTPPSATASRAKPVGPGTTVPPKLVTSPKAPAGPVEIIVPLAQVPNQLPRYKLSVFNNGSTFSVLRTGKLPSEPPNVDRPLPKAAPKDDQRAQFRTDANGSFEIYPSFNELVKRPLQRLDVGQGLQRLTPGLSNVVPRDNFSSVVVTDVRLLHRAQLKRGDAKPERGGREDQPRLMYVALRRRVNEYPVDGPGSRVAVAIDADDNVRAARYEWKPAAINGTEDSAWTPEEVHEAIRKMLSEVGKNLSFRVKRIELVYYDDGKELRPTYRYLAEQLQTRESLGGSDHYTGYLPYGKPNASLPVLNAKTDKPAPDIAQAGAGPAKAAPLLVKRYVVRNDSPSWADSAEDFWQSMVATSGPLKFKTSKLEYTHPFHYVGRKDKHVNVADLALVEAHGFPFGFTTEKDYSDPVRIGFDIPTSGLGAASGGRLKHWLLHSCESVPSAAEYEANWADEWWEVFKGLGSVIGYRSSMFIADGAGAALAPSLRSGAAVVPAWFSAVASLNIYSLDSEAMFACAKKQPKAGFAMGRPAAINACEYADLSAAERGPDRADCLEVWWLDDEPTTPARRPAAPAGDKPNECPEKGGPGIGNYKPPTSG